MDGKQLQFYLKKCLNEVDSSAYVSTRYSYDLLNEAAQAYVRLTQCLTGKQTITTVASQSAYDLNPDFLALYLKNDTNEYTVQFDDGTSDNYWVSSASMNSVILQNTSGTAAIPNSFYIRNKETDGSVISSTATATGSLSGGKTLLTDATQTFTTLNAAYPGDMVHNTTDGSDGVVIQVVSGTTLYASLFGGTNNYFTSSNAYVLVPMGRKQIIFDPPTTTAGYSAYVYYIKKPTPIYSDYQTWQFDPQVCTAICKYAAWLYKYRDREPDFADKWYISWQNQVREINAIEKQGLIKRRWKVNLSKRSYGDRSTL